MLGGQKDKMSSKCATPTRTTWVVLFLLASLLVLFSAHLNGIALPTWDAAYYLSLADQLSLGNGYRLAGEEFHHKYFPGLPTFISLLQTFAISGPTAGAILTITAAITVMWALLTLTPRLTASERWIALGVLATHHLFLIHISLISSEMIFACFSFLFLILLDRPTRTPAMSIASATFLFLACITRPEGVLLFIPLAWRLFLQFQSQNWSSDKTLVLSAIIVSIGLSVLISTFLFSGTSYAREFHFPTLSHVLQQLSMLMSLGILFLIAAIVGGVFGFNRGFVSHLLFVLPFLALHCVWWFVDERFYLCILGSLTLFAAIGISNLAVYLSERLRTPYKIKLISITLLILVVFEQVPLLHSNISLDYQTHNANYLELYQPLTKLTESMSLQTFSGCQTVAVPELVVYRYYLAPLLQRTIDIVPYDTRQTIYATIAKHPGVKTCIIVDYIHFPIFNLEKTQRIDELGKSGCTDAVLRFEHHVDSGYFLEVYACAALPSIIS